MLHAHCEIVMITQLKTLSKSFTCILVTLEWFLKSRLLWKDMIGLSSADDRELSYRQTPVSLQDSLSLLNLSFVDGFVKGFKFLLRYVAQAWRGVCDKKISQMYHQGNKHNVSFSPGLHRCLGVFCFGRMSWCWDNSSCQRQVAMKY